MRLEIDNSVAECDAVPNVAGDRLAAVNALFQVAPYRVPERPMR